MIYKLASMAKQKDFSIDNWVYGSGGGLLQKFDRDTQKFAIKASYMETKKNDEIQGISISKDPITSKGKRSKPGMLKLLNSHDSFLTISTDNCPLHQFDSYKDELETVFLNGEITRTQTFDEIRNLSNYYLSIEK